MKKFLFTYILMYFSLLASPQAIHIFHDGETKPDVVPNINMERVYVAPKFLGSTEYQQVFVTTDGERRYDKVDSVKFNLPHLILTNYNTRDILFVPKDYGCLKLATSCQGGESPVLIFPDGSSLPSYVVYDDISTLYRWDIWIEDDNKRTETWHFVSGEMQDNIVVNYTGLPFANNPYKEICFSNEENEYTFDTNFSDSKLNFNAPGIDWYYNEDGKPIIHFSRNESGEMRSVELGLSVGPFEMNNHWMNQLGKPFMHTSEEHMAALREFCDATNFDNWGKNTNWWSDEPLWKWDGCINKDRWSNYYWHINDHIVNLVMPGEAHGTLPASFEVFMDDVDGELDLSNCSLYGIIPYNIRYHKDWSKHGWNFIQQNTWAGGGFDMDDINLRIDNVEVEDFVNGTISNTYDMLKKHKITWVFNAGAVDILDGISDERVNKYLDYCGKGFGIIATVSGFWDTPYDNYRNYVLGQRSVNGLPESIIWTKGFDKADVGPIGSMSLLDCEGNLLWYRLYDSKVPDSFYLNELDRVLQKYLGEPLEHEIYVSSHYESTDYSHDGEVLTLQKASVGKGIDMVFMGDMYVDTLLVDGGQYEQDMHAAMEYFFEVEPYKTLRDRFNVYAVKVVSLNGHDGSEHRFNFNNDLVFEYAQKVPDVDMDHVAITVINYNPNFSFFESAETAWWESGTSIAWIEEGGPSYIICHETGGHGIAKLLDEYIYGGYEENHTQDGYNEEFRNWIKTAYHDKGGA